MTRLFWIALSLGLAPSSLALAARSCVDVAAQPGDEVYPTFCSIPAVPKDVRDAAAFKAAVVDTRLVGRDLVGATQPDRFSLGGTAAFVARAELEAAPPPPITTPDQGDTAAFIKDARARVTPPRRSR